MSFKLIYVLLIKKRGLHKRMENLGENGAETAKTVAIHSGSTVETIGDRNGA